jgi:hypothetical protein
MCIGRLDDMPIVSAKGLTDKFATTYVICAKKRGPVSGGVPRYQGFTHFPRETDCKLYVYIGILVSHN